MVLVLCTGKVELELVSREGGAYKETWVWTLDVSGQYKMPFSRARKDQKKETSTEYKDSVAQNQYIHHHSCTTVPYLLMLKHSLLPHDL